MHHGQAEEHDVDLQKQRRATQDVYVYHRDGAHDPKAADLHERKNEAKHDGKGIGRNNNAQAHEPAREEREERRKDELRLKEHAKELVGVPRLHPRLLIEKGHGLLKPRV